MPSAAKHPCAQAGCPSLVSGQARCERHTTQADKSWGSAQPPARIRGRKLQEMRRRLFQRQPLCVECLKQGLTTIATIRDHIIPLAEGGRDDATNEQALCQGCSDTKTQRESQRGRQRWG